MGYCLARGDESKGFNVAGWGEVLALARKYGWKPLGTLAPLRWNEAKRGKWEGAYGGNDWQIVTAEDADNLAAALERALESIGYESQHWQDGVRDFAAFCREGGFEIA